MCVQFFNLCTKKKRIYFTLPSQMSGRQNMEWDFGVWIGVKSCVWVRGVGIGAGVPRESGVQLLVGMTHESRIRVLSQSRNHVFVMSRNLSLTHVWDESEDLSHVGDGGGRGGEKSFESKVEACGRGIGRRFSLGFISMTTFTTATPFALSPGRDQTLACKHVVVCHQAIFCSSNEYFPSSELNYCWSMGLHLRRILRLCVVILHATQTIPRSSETLLGIVDSHSLILE